MKRLLSLIVAILMLTSISLIGCDDGHDEVKVSYFTNASEIVTLMALGEENNGLDIALLPEPAVSSLSKVAKDKTFYTLNLQELYDKDVKNYPQAVLLIKQSVLNSYPSIVGYLSQTFNDNMAWVSENTTDAVNVINSKVEEGLVASLKAPLITADVIKNCNIFWQSSNDSKEQVKKYVNELISFSENSAKTITDDFFYNEEQGQNKVEKEKLTFACPDGAPALAIAKYIKDNDTLKTDKQIDYVVTASDKLGPKYVVNPQTSADIVVAPINLASKLYNSNSNDSYKMVSVVTHGNLYIVSSSKIQLNDLKDKTMGVIGQGLVPDLTLKIVLKKNNLNIVVAD